MTNPSPPSTEGPDLTLEQVAEQTGTQIRTLQAMARRGALPGCYKIGKHWRVRRSALDSIRNPS